MYVGMSALHRERNDLGLARQLLARTEELGEHTGLPQNRHRWRIAMARVLEAEGDPDAALDLLDEAQRVYTPDFSPNVRPIPAIRARVLIAQGRLDEALSWAREWGLSAADDLTYLREFEHITLARVLLARNAAEHDQRHSRRGNRSCWNVSSGPPRKGTGRAASSRSWCCRRSPCECARTCAPRCRRWNAPWRWPSRRATSGCSSTRAPPWPRSSRRPRSHGIAHDYVRRLQNALSGAEERAPVTQGLVDPLSQRELDVLRLLGTDLGGPDIARELVLSLNTVRTHTKNIYAKLGVNSRRAAVRRAEELDLMSRSGRR